jgi:hypothetical protein
MVFLYLDDLCWAPMVIDWQDHKFAIPHPGSDGDIIRAISARRSLQEKEGYSSHIAEIDIAQVHHKSEHALYMGIL